MICTFVGFGLRQGLREWVLTSHKLIALLPLPQVLRWQAGAITPNLSDLAEKCWCKWIKYGTLESVPWRREVSDGRTERLSVPALWWAGMPEHHCEKGHRLVCWLLLSIWHNRKSWERREPQLWESSPTRLAYAAFSWLQIHVGSPACFEKAGLANHEQRTWKPVYQFLPWFPQEMFVTWK